MRNIRVWEEAPRPESLLTSTADANTSTVAETLSTGKVFSQGGFSLYGYFTTTGTSVTVNYSYSNGVLAFASAPGIVGIAAVSATFHIYDQCSNEVAASPAELHFIVFALPNRAEMVTLGVGSTTLSLAGLRAGDVYELSISGQAYSSVFFGIVLIAFRAYLPRKN